MRKRRKTGDQAAIGVRKDVPCVVIVSDPDERNILHFEYKTKGEALEFAARILDMSGYDVTIFKGKEGGKK